ncbi:hypothetical protein HPB49_024696 [Dermacentor silvarum]|uniref:Uncharacterized protein n=1 Tax=Dermacentor silvarum TaxID=543639 RepID=A0ACB8CNG9_DERSI|nr:hypothetical protein HPB49_024696 [Dermacentor silvarum]
MAGTIQDAVSKAGSRPRLPDTPTCMGTSTTRDTTPDLSLLMGTLDASWQNVGTNLGSDHNVIRITIRGPTLKTWEKQQLDIVEKHTQMIATTHQTPRIDAKLAHLWKARRSLTKRGKRPRHNKKLRKRIREINDKAAEYAADLCKESWLDLCDGYPPAKRGSSSGTSSTR